MIQFTLKLIFIGALIFLASCATMTQGSREALEINTVPAGAKALTNIPNSGSRSVDGYLGCEPTPCSISLSRKLSPMVTISLEGHHPIKFKATSAVATSSTSIPAGSLVSGLPPGSQIIAGKPSFLKRIPVGGRVIAGGVLTFGAGSVLDVTVGANKNIAPNPVTAYLAPIEDEAND